MGEIKTFCDESGEDVCSAPSGLAENGSHRVGRAVIGRRGVIGPAASSEAGSMALRGGQFESVESRGHVLWRGFGPASGPIIAPGENKKGWQPFDRQPLGVRYWVVEVVSAPESNEGLRLPRSPA